MFAGKKSAQIREILISESAWEEMTCLFAPSPNNRPKGEVSFHSNKIEDAETSEKTVVERDITVADIENIDNLNLDDFSCDFSKIEIPEGSISDDAMDDLVSQFFNGLAEAA